MLSIDTNGNIKVTRGDTFKLPLFIDVSKNVFNSIRFPLKINDTIFFYITQGNNICKPLIKKEFTIDNINNNGDIIISFEHADTNWMSPCTYFYEIKLVRIIDNEKKVITIVPQRKFVIEKGENL